MSPATVHHVEAVFSIVRKIHERDPDDPVDDLDVNMAIWEISYKDGFLIVRGHFAQAISCSNVGGVFPFHERFWFCLVQVSTTQFCSFPSFLMARASDGTNVPISAAPASSSKIWRCPNGSLPDLEGTGFAPVRWRRKPMKFADSYRSSCRMRLQS